MSTPADKAPAPPPRRCQACGKVGADVRTGPQEPRLLCDSCWFHSRPVPEKG